MTSDIRPGISDAYISNYGIAQDAAYEEWPQLTTDGAETIMSALSANLWRYRREPDSRFITWASAWVKRETRRHRFLTAIFHKFDDLLFAAIERGSQGSTQDWAVEPKDLKDEIFLHLLANPRKLDQLMKPRKAKTSTMLYKLAKSRTWGYRTHVNDRRALVMRWLKDVLAKGCEIADPPEHLDPYEEKSMNHELIAVR